MMTGATPLLEETRVHLIKETDMKLESLKVQLKLLDGKEHKRDRQMLNRAIWTLENDEQYIEALKTLRDEERKQKDLAEHQMLLARRKTDEEEKLRKLEEQTRARHAREAKEAKEAIARVRELAELHAKEFEAHLVVNRIRKGDQTHVPRIGSFVGITYEARFAEGTVYEGESYSGYPFDTTLKKEGKDQLPIHQPLTFRLGEGKAIKGVEEVLRTMSLGERVQVTIDSAWAYRKGGLQDDLGNMLVPPHANLVFDLQLVRVGNDEYAKKDKSGAPRSPRLGASSPPGSPKIAPMSPTSPLSPSMWPTGGGMRSYHSPKSPKSPKSPLSPKPVGTPSSPRFAPPKMAPLPSPLEIS